MTFIGHSLVGASLAQADATFSYELSGSDDKKTLKQFSIAQFFVRVDDPGKEKLPDGDLFPGAIDNE